MTEGIELLNPDKIGTLEEKESYKYLGILESDNIKQAEMIERKKEKNYHRRTRKLRETKVYCINLIKGMKKNWAVSFVR